MGMSYELTVFVKQCYLGGKRAGAVIDLDHELSWVSESTPDRLSPATLPDGLKSLMFLHCGRSDISTKSVPGAHRIVEELSLLRAIAQALSPDSSVS